MHAYRDQYAQIFRGGRDVVLIAISADSVEELAAWARDDELPFLMASDADLEAGRSFGALHSSGQLTNRSLFVIAPDGTISYRATPFREVDPTAYEELERAIEEAVAAGEGDGEG